MMWTRQGIRIMNSNRAKFFKNIQTNRANIGCPCRSHAQRRISNAAINKCSVNLSSGRGNISQTVSTEFLKNTDRMSSEELLEKLIAGLSTDIHQKNRVYKNDLMRVINRVKEMNFSTKKQGLLLLRCCTELLPDETPSARMALVELVWNTLKPHTKFQVDHYNELLQAYIANNRTIVVTTFINKMLPVKPNITTYELIIRALGEAGDLNQATEVLSNMKAQNLPATENIFNSLIIGQGKAGNLQNIQEVLTMMKSVKLKQSIETYTAVARALAWNKEDGPLLKEMDQTIKNGFQFEERHIMEIVKTLAVVGSYKTIPQVLKYLPEGTLQTPSISPYMQSVCTLLVFQNHPMAALEIYKCLPLPSFGPKDDQGLHGRSLVRDCVKAAMPSSVIGLITQELMASGRNPIALHNATEAALQLGKIPLSLDLFTRMKQLGMPLRPHYFWPILITNSKSYGEKGIMSVLSTMIEMDVKPDYETIMSYTLPFVSFTSPQNLMKKFLDAGLTVTTVLTPMMESLLNTGQVRAASEICELFNGKVDVEIILKPLLRGYLTNGDVKSTVHILEDVLKKGSENKDWIGRFLCCFINHKKVMEDLTDFFTLVQELKNENLKISTSASDYCVSRLPNTHSDAEIERFRSGLAEITDETLVDDGEMFAHQPPHPKNMNEASLKAHLSELEAKNMNTRGVLRRLLQQYCKEGNLKAAKEVAEKCQKEGVFLSAGMKASIFDLHVKLGELELAELTLADLNKTSPNFTLDEFKVIDFATLMVYRKRIKQATELLNEQSKKRRIIGGRGIIMNCWRLLDATAANGSPEDVRKMLETLTALRYCKPNNVLLGPLVRVHLKNDNLEEALNEFVRLAKQYSMTPLKHELLCKILEAMGDGRSEDNFIIHERSNSRLNKMAQTILNTDRKVHGASDVQLTLIAALAEVGYKKTIRKLFLDPKVNFHPEALYRRCERFADEKKLKALECIAECARDVRRVNVDDIYELMLDVHQRDDNCQEALSLWTKMQEADVTPSQKFVRNICSLLKANNRTVPSELSLLLDKQDKVTSVLST
ncbi:leucine-rich PPR motif-containing protein, mitochondrial isoform X1 [Bombyx mori]|uniref:Leucine-rich PPR motif-containing protein, mitochondrial n=1 Tax=Bombyx mori TaxID=7091 RepID=A0A8R2AKN2_BOMMO|nr:leucine-rich PPR motif-containing protein, mitochondrial isoform X1 [Bombyx mori]